MKDLMVKYRYRFGLQLNTIWVIISTMAYCDSDRHRIVLPGVEINLNFMVAHRTSYVKILLVLHIFQ